MNKKLKEAKAAAEAEEGKLNAINEKADALEAENQANDDKLATMEEELDEMEKKLVANIASFGGAEKVAEEGRHAKNQMEANAAKDGSKRSRLQAELDEMKAQTAVLVEKIKTVMAESVAIEEQLDENDERCEMAEDQTKGLEVEATSVSNVLRSNETSEAASARRAEEGMSEIDKLSLKYADVEKVALELEAETASLEEQTEEADVELAGLKQKHQDTLREIQLAVNEINDM